MIIMIQHYNSTRAEMRRYNTGTSLIYCTVNTCIQFLNEERTKKRKYNREKPSQTPRVNKNETIT